MKTLSALLIILASLMSSACSTVEGLGKDIQRVGQSIEKESKR